MYVKALNRASLPVVVSLLRSSAGGSDNSAVPFISHCLS
jgi:hypothetical protein